MDDKIAILFLTVNPVDTERLRIDQEIRDICETIRRAKYRNRFEPSKREAVRIRDLQEALQDLEGKPAIVHFAGHGDSSAIYFEEDDGTTLQADGRALRNFFRNFPNVQCVVLNACHSSAVAEALAEVVPCAVGMRTEITDKHAIAFAVAFYNAIGAGYEYERAYGIAESVLDFHARDIVQPILKTKSASGTPVDAHIAPATRGVPTAVTRGSRTPARRAELASFRGLRTGVSKFSEARSILGRTGTVSYQRRDGVDCPCLKDDSQGMQLEFEPTRAGDMVLESVTVEPPYAEVLPYGLVFGMPADDVERLLDPVFFVDAFLDNITVCEPRESSQQFALNLWFRQNKLIRLQVCEACQ